MKAQIQRTVRRIAKQDNRIDPTQKYRDEVDRRRREVQARWSPREEKIRRGISHERLDSDGNEHWKPQGSDKWT